MIDTAKPAAESIVEHRAMTIREYHAESEHESNSTLAAFHENRLEYYLRKQGELEPRPQSEDMALSDGVHGLALGDFAETCCVLPPGPYTTKAAREARDVAKMANRDKTCLTPDQHEHALRIWQAIQENPHAMELLSGRTEYSLFGTHGKTGIKIKVRCDVLRDNGDVVDLKVMRRPDDEDLDHQWSKWLWMYGYYRQAALYQKMAERYTGIKGKFWHVIAFKSDKPWETNPVLVREVSADTLKLGWAHQSQILRALKECRELESIAPGPHNWQSRFCMPAVSELPQWAFEAEFIA